jgi:Apea-like HEPN
MKFTLIEVPFFRLLVTLRKYKVNFSSTLLCHAMSTNTNFAFVANKYNANCKLPFEIIEGCYFQKANYTQIEQIKKYLISSGYFQINKVFPYEFMYTKEENENKYQGQYMEPENWQYYVLSFQCHNSKIYDLAMVANLTAIELEIGLQFLYHQEVGCFGILHNPIHMSNYFLEMSFNIYEIPDFLTINDSHLQEIGLIYKLFCDLDNNKYPNINKAIEMFNDLKNLSHVSPFKNLALFTIIEFLITHKPIDTGDSITRQVSNKIPLLSHRFSQEINYSQFFQSASENTIWKKLYTYRSSIAHGSEPDFTKDLSVLRDEATVRQFLKFVVKKLLQHSLVEPQLYTDLKEC